MAAPSLKADKDRFDRAGALVLVWSRHVLGEPGLRREAAAAAARGRLTVARVDGARPPPSLRTRQAFTVSRTNPIPGPRALARTLAAALAKTPGASNAPERKRPMNASPAMNGPAADTTNYRSTWKGTLLVAVLLAGVAYGALYVVLGASPAPAIMKLLS